MRRQFLQKIHFTVLEISYVLARSLVLRRKRHFLDFQRAKNNTPNLRCAPIFNAQKCDIKVGIKFEIIRRYKQDDIKYKLTDLQQRGCWWQMLFTPALPITRQKLQDYFEGYSEFYLKIVVYVFNDFSQNPSSYSAELGRHRYMCTDI
jgi:hypothetical protein